MPRINNEPKRPWQSEAKANRNRKPDPFYTSAAWRKLRNQYIATQPICEHCKQAGNYKPAKVVDHIMPRKNRPDLELDWDNLQSLCQRCHQQKTAKENS